MATTAAAADERPTASNDPARRPWSAGRLTVTKSAPSSTKNSPPRKTALRPRAPSPAARVRWPCPPRSASTW
eukprot:4226078-Alexandrium_andersonii.AAC.1